MKTTKRYVTQNGGLTYSDFCNLIRAQGWTIAQVHCDVPPCPELLTLIDVLGPAYERHALRYCREND
jgi:hypothetical protein